MITKLVLFFVSLLFLNPSSGISKKGSPCTYLFIKSSLLAPNPVQTQNRGPVAESSDCDTDSDSEYSEDRDNPTPPQRRRLSGTLIQSLAGRFLSPEGIAECLSSKGIACPEDTMDRLKDGFCEPNCFSTAYWENLLADPSTRHLIAVVYLNLSDENSTTTEALEETFRTLSRSFPQGETQTCLPAWILNELAAI